MNNDNCRCESSLINFETIFYEQFDKNTVSVLNNIQYPKLRTFGAVDNILF